jgi:hypothetical protein
MNRALHPTVFRYLRSVQKADHVGKYAHLRGPNHSPPATVYRWHHQLGDHLLAIPNITVEALGLRHVHLFITRPDTSWLESAYAVEAAWVTNDFCKETLYLHLLLPTTISLEAITRPAEQLHSAVSSSGWQQFLLDDEFVQLPVDITAPCSDVVQRCPIAIPALMESWQHPNSLPLMWARIKQRLGERTKKFLKTMRVKEVNGKMYLSHAFSELRKDQLIRQHIVRYHPLLAASVEVFLQVQMERAGVTALIERLRTDLHAVETYPMTDGYFCRLLADSAEGERLSGGKPNGIPG